MVFYHYRLSQLFWLLVMEQIILVNNPVGGLYHGKALEMKTPIFLGGLQGIPKELYEAAELDGSEGWRKHVDITLPLLRPYVTLVAVISAIAATKVFEEVFLMTQGGPADSTRTLVYYVYDQAFAELEISYACTVGLALFLLVLLLTAIRLAFGGERSLI